jgi:hypothetical protein
MFMKHWNFGMSIASHEEMQIPSYPNLGLKNWCHDEFSIISQWTTVSIPLNVPRVFPDIRNKGILKFVSNPRGYFQDNLAQACGTENINMVTRVCSSTRDTCYGSMG